MFDDDDDYERSREESIRERNEWLASFLNKDEIAKAIGDLKNAFQPKTPKSNRKRKRGENDVVHFKVQIPIERRQSARLSKLPAEFHYTDLPEEDSDKKKRDDSFEDLIKPVFLRERRTSVARRASAAPVVPVDQITEEYLSKIAMNSSNKTYCPIRGTSCHQCRQKTMDSKTYCRSGRCVGVQGQFCGPCLKNRYGEDAAVVLLDPNWACPPCRGICNCSICRNRKGMRPTGILAHLAFENGYDSVHHFLLSLKGKWDYAEDSEQYLEKQKECSLDNILQSSEPILLGFDEDGFPILQNPMALKLPDDRNSFVLLGYDKNKLAVTLPEKEYFHEMAELYCTYPDAIHKQCEQTLKKIIDRLNEYQKQLLQTELC